MLDILLIIASRDGLDKTYSPVLCKLLFEEWHFSQEDIVMMLEDIKDPNSIESLFNAALKIPGHDDGRSLAKKCIWTLKAINTKSAIEKIILLSHSDDEIIRKNAILNL